MRTGPASSLLLALLLVALPLRASDHRDAPIIGEDATVNLANLLVWRSPSDPSRTVLAMTVNPFTVPGINAFFSPYCIYQFAVDNNGDNVEDLVLQATFHGTGRDQTVELRGPARPERTGRKPKPLGGQALVGPTNEVIEGKDVRLFAGLRDDPFFFDQQAFFVTSELRDPGVDFYAGKNVSAVVVELPTSALMGKGKELRVWAVGARRVGNEFFQQDRLGKPAVNVVLIPPAMRDDFNTLGVPSEDAKGFGTGLRQSLESLGIADGGVRDALAAFLLPDVLPYDPAKDAGFPNGRRPEDDVIDTVLGLLAGKGAAVPHDPKGAPTDHVGANDVPFLRTFPFLAPPHTAR